MIELKKNRIRFSFPRVHPDAELMIEFQRTLRLPDDGINCPMPPSHGSFPVVNLDEYQDKLPIEWRGQHGAMLPIHPSEALWISFHPKHKKERDVSYPFAVKVSYNKINAISGHLTRFGLQREPQNYMVVPNQPWLDGFFCGLGTVKQFIGQRGSKEGNNEENIAIHLEVFPMKGEVFDTRFPELLDDTPHLGSEDLIDWWNMDAISESVDMGIMPGGVLKQEISQDTFNLTDWEHKNSSRCTVHLASARIWRRVTGKLPGTKPPMVEEYKHAGLPWLDSYQPDRRSYLKERIIGNLFKSKKSKNKKVTVQKKLVVAKRG